MSTLKKAAQQQIKAYLERIERLEEEKKAISDDIKAVYAELKAEGFDNKAMRRLVKARKLDADERNEQDTLLTTYMHAVGMAEAPLFAAVGAMATDTAARESLIEAFKLLVPDFGEIICKVGGAPVRLWRDEKGAARVEDYVEDKPPPKERAGKSLKPSATVLSIVPTTPEEQIKRAADAAAQRRADERTARSQGDAPSDDEHEDA